MGDYKSEKTPMGNSINCCLELPTHLVMISRIWNLTCKKQWHIDYQNTKLRLRNNVEFLIPGPPERMRTWGLVLSNESNSLLEITTNINFLILRLLKFRLSPLFLEANNSQSRLLQEFRLEKLDGSHIYSNIDTYRFVFDAKDGFR